MARRIAIIPARGGSKRIPMKNVRDFCGLPMIGHILRTARESKLFDVIHVSTEDHHVREVVESLGFVVDFPRPAELAEDLTPIMPVLKYVVETYSSRGKLFEEVWLLMACAPLIEASDLNHAAELMKRTGNCQKLLAVASYPVPIEWAFERNQDGKLTPLHPGMFAVRSQDLGKKYFDSGTFAVFPEAVVRTACGVGSDAEFIGYVLDRNKAIDIDDEDDWKSAEAVFQQRYNNIFR